MGLLRNAEQCGLATHRAGTTQSSAQGLRAGNPASAEAGLPGPAKARGPGERREKPKERSPQSPRHTNTGLQTSHLHLEDVFKQAYFFLQHLFYFLFKKGTKKKKSPRYF